MKKEKILFIILIILIFITLTFGGYIIYKKIELTNQYNTNTENNEQQKENNNTSNSTNENNSNNINNSPSNEQIINLTEEKQSIALNNNEIKLNFKGKTNKENILQYNLKIIINDKSLKENIFTKEELYIWKSDYAATFKFTEHKELYFFISYIAKQNDGEWILITDKTGNIIKEFYDVSISFTDDKTFVIIDCKNNNIMADCEEKTYTIENNTIKEK